MIAKPRQALYFVKNDVYDRSKRGVCLSNNLFGFGVADLRTCHVTRAHVKGYSRFACLLKTYGNAEDPYTYPLATQFHVYESPSAILSTFGSKFGSKSRGRNDKIRKPLDHPKID